MILRNNKVYGNRNAIIDDQGYALSYHELLSFCYELSNKVPKRSLVFIMCENIAGILAGYIACFENESVPLMVAGNIDDELLDILMVKYRPQFIWGPDKLLEKLSFPVVFSKYGCDLKATDYGRYEMHPDLSLLLTTSGSTGSPKFVRHSYKNVLSNSKNIADVFDLDENERGMVSLPLQFTQGLNVATSHLYAGSTVLLSKSNFMQVEFWEFFKKQKAASLTGVPYSIELLDKIRFFNMDLPHFKTINQGGGRLSDVLFMKCAKYAHDTNRRFIATYGATETTARMAFLSPDLAIRKCGSIGGPIPEGSFTLVDDNGKEIEDHNVTGEIIYKGPNVTLGYAESYTDLQKGDERQGVYQTGDLAYKDSDGCYFIVGRKKRFLKLFGNRISLDETERMISNEFAIACACTGNDKSMNVFIEKEMMKNAVHMYLADKTGIHSSAFNIVVIDGIPKNEAGKVQYKLLDAKK